LPHKGRRKHDVMPQGNPNKGEDEPDWPPQEVSREALQQSGRNFDTSSRVARHMHEVCHRRLIANQRHYHESASASVPEWGQNANLKSRRRRERAS
jgi:hypothetical protein